MVTLHSPLGTGFTDRLPELPALPSRTRTRLRPKVRKKRQYVGKAARFNPILGANAITPSGDEVIIEKGRAIVHATGRISGRSAAVKIMRP